MRVTGWPSYWKEAEGIVPVDLQDVDIRGTPDELRTLAQFLIGAAEELEVALRHQVSFRSAVDFGDDKPGAQTPIIFEVIAEIPSN